MFEGSTLKPAFVSLLTELAKNPVSRGDVPIAEGRRQTAEKWAVPEEQQATVARILTQAFEGPYGTVPLKIFIPEGEGPFPVLVHYHGGGWVFGTVESATPFCRKLAHGAGCIVVTVGYHLAPEFPYPAAVDDCYAALKWVAEHAHEFGGDSTRLAVCGESAGGNLAAVTCLRVRDEGGPPIRYQGLFYPNVTADLSGAEDTPEREFLNSADMQWFYDQYLPTHDAGSEPYCSPLLADDLSKLPPALVVVPEHDILAADALKYAERLDNCETLFCEGMIHAFLVFPFGVDDRESIIDNICAKLHQQL